MSNADREQVLARLNTAVGEGRLTLAEFEERVDGVLRARTYGEVEPYLADLPAGTVSALVPTAAPVRDVVEWQNTASNLRRAGRWTVPRRLVIHNRAGSVKLDFTSAVITHPTVEIDLDVRAGSTLLILPDGASADIDEVRTVAGSTRSRVPSPGDVTGPGIRFVVTGSQHAGSLTVRYQRRFWRWRW
jgi:Domain of unknown function (DUF1707)